MGKSRFSSSSVSSDSFESEREYKGVLGKEEKYRGLEYESK